MSYYAAWRKSMMQVSSCLLVLSVVGFAFAGGDGTVHPADQKRIEEYCAKAAPCPPPLPVTPCPPAPAPVPVPCPTPTPVSPAAPEAPVFVPYLLIGAEIGRTYVGDERVYADLDNDFVAYAVSADVAIAPRWLVGMRYGWGDWDAPTARLARCFGSGSGGGWGEPCVKRGEADSSLKTITVGVKYKIPIRRTGR